MLCLLLFSAVTFSQATEDFYYPMIIPISSGSRHRHLTHVMTHPVIRTQVLMLGDEAHRNPHKHNHDQKQLPPQVEYDHSPDYTHSYHHNHEHSHLNVWPDNYHSNEHRNEIPTPKGRTHSVSPSIKYSIPVEKSSWKPIPGIPYGYKPLRYLGEDEGMVYKILQQALSESDYDSESRTHLILPTGIKKLHNPQLRIHPYKKLNSIYNEAETVGRNTNSQTVYGKRLRQNGVLHKQYNFDDEVRCH